MYFKDIIGQKKITDYLINTVKSGHIPHAQMICGNAGYGTLQIALAYARYINCTGEKETDSCGKCPSCLQFDKLMHPDVHFVFPIHKSGSSKKTYCDNFLPEWRDMLLKNKYFSYNDWISRLKTGNSQGMIYAEESDNLLKKLQYKAYESEYKITIIWMPEKMNAICANKILKIIEEPPEKTIFLFVTEDINKILPTIISRTQIINVKGIAPKSICTEIIKSHKLPENEAEKYSRLAMGDMLKAEEYIKTKGEEALFLKQFVNSMRAAYMIANFSQNKRKEKQDSLLALKEWSEEMAKKGREYNKRYLAYAQRMLRENFILNLKNENLNYLSSAEYNFSKKFSPFINSGNIYNFTEELDLAISHIENNVNSKMVFFDIALRSIMLFKK